MKKLGFLAIFATFFFTSCDDGEIITTSFDFPETNLQFCGGPGGYLFYKTNDAGTESISLLLGNANELFQSSDTLATTLNGTSNIVNYRIYNDVVDGTYFCSEVPPTTPQVVTEYIASSGTAVLYINTTLFDNDNLDENEEGLTIDTDNDGLLNYYDFDDDGDNVPTILELDTENADGDNNPLTNPKDTDNDGIPDYLDEDDDGDGILTRYEDADGDLDSTNDITDPSVGADYLNPAVANSNPIDEYREHEFNYTSDIILILENFILINGEEEINRERFPMGTIDAIETGVQTVVPVFVD